MEWLTLSNDVIATVVGGAATDNYGVVGMASKNQIRDNISEILKKRTTHAVSLFVKKIMELLLMFISLYSTALKFQKFAGMCKRRSSTTLK